MDLSLTGGSLPRAALDHLAHDDFIDLVGVHAAAANRFADYHRAELGGGKRRQTAEIAPDRGANGGDDDGGSAVAHESGPVKAEGKLGGRWLGG